MKIAMNRKTLKALLCGPLAASLLVIGLVAAAILVVLLVLLDLIEGI